MRTHVSRIARARAGPGIYRIGYAMTRATSEALLLQSARTSYSRVCVCGVHAGNGIRQAGTICIVMELGYCVSVRMRVCAIWRAYVRGSVVAHSPSNDGIHVGWRRARGSTTTAPSNRSCELKRRDGWS